MQSIVDVDRDGTVQTSLIVQGESERRVELTRAWYQDNNVMNLVWMRRGNLVWSGQESATQIKTIDTLVVIQTEPGVAWHGILGLSVVLVVYLV